MNLYKWTCQFPTLLKSIPLTRLDRGLALHTELIGKPIHVVDSDKRVHFKPDGFPE